MELGYVKEFVVLVETRYYAEAAEKLFISPSSLTRHIQVMEKELGKPLFHRTSRKVELTDFGRAFLPYAKKLVEVLEEYSTNLLVKMRRDEKVIVGNVGGLAPYNLGSLIAGFKQENRDIELEYIQIPPDRQFEMLRDNSCDFLVTGEDRIPKEEYNAVISGRDHFAAVVSCTHPLADKGFIELRDLMGEKLALNMPLANENGDFMIRCREAGFRPDFLEIDIHNMIDFAAIGGRIVIMPKRPAEFFSDDSVAVIDIEPKIISEMALFYRKSPGLSPKEKRFLEYFKAVRHEEAL